MDRIILIGPIYTGKSTVATLLSKKLSIPRYEMDDLRFRYYNEIGYNKATAKKIKKDQGIFELCKFWKPYEAYAVQRILQDYHSGIVDFGAGHSVYDDEKLFELVEIALKPIKHVILLIPSEDKEESQEILNSRTKHTIIHDLNKVFINHPSNYKLAKLIIYTKDKSVEDICNEIIDKINLG